MSVQASLTERLNTLDNSIFLYYTGNSKETVENNRRTLMTQQQNELQTHPLYPLDWDDAHGYGRGDILKTASFEIDGFTVNVNVAYDYDHDWTDCRGHFTSTWQEGALKNPNARYERNAYEYFMPDNTVAATLRDYLRLGYTVQAARMQAVKQVKEDRDIAIDSEQAGYYVVGVTATVTYKGVELGCDSLWGIELADNDDSYIDRCAEGCITSALHEAREKLAELRNTPEEESHP